MSRKGSFRWTSQHQSIAEVAAACGVSLLRIGKVLGFDNKTVAYHLCPREAERRRSNVRQWRAANLERCDANHLAWRRTNSERRIYYNMVRRCAVPSAGDYPRYGGRGITVCDRWLSSIDAFLEDMGPRPSPRHSIDRVNNNRGYEPGNCRWETAKPQSRNRSTNRIVSYGGQEMSLAEAVEAAGLSRSLVNNRLRLGWSVDEALEAVPRQRPKRPK